ncbi:50S ribosomal protein L29 [Candidatus Saccharibacteria bacterium RIFCSPLOWO2_01_FULL_48_13]|nr:MAG: 50S ribosomal protein L29 [Candidatus Saccharibacteria bacterium RIFCSPHIGHO2_01_FULL_48_12]OGL35331.1 MAG: 50S ribosomal protein L29 [Candidatus Saccharibacteria bacterium RIFCSPHIGHO2_12_FULL_48_21]OGL37566.1 MAG: 50S ribosomal protein L29 [Candidatus Saccharibacteria bacterium RIFCSPLOWO2_01_FULL_48_13]
MKIIEVRKLTTQQLASQSTNLRDEIAELRRRTLGGEVQNVKLLKSKRRDLARMLTVLTEQLAKEKM